MFQMGSSISYLVYGLMFWLRCRSYVCLVPPSLFLPYDSPPIQHRCLWGPSPSLCHSSLLCQHLLTWGFCLAGEACSSSCAANWKYSELVPPQGRNSCSLQDTGPAAVPETLRGIEPSAHTCYRVSRHRPTFLLPWAAFRTHPLTWISDSKSTSGMNSMQCWS